MQIGSVGLVYLAFRAVAASERKCFYLPPELKSTTADTLTGKRHNLARVVVLASWDVPKRGRCELSAIKCTVRSHVMYVIGVLQGQRRRNGALLITSAFISVYKQSDLLFFTGRDFVRKEEDWLIVSSCLS